MSIKSPGGRKKGRMLQPQRMRISRSCPATSRACTPYLARARGTYSCTSRRCKPRNCLPLPQALASTAYEYTAWRILLLSPRAATINAKCNKGIQRRLACIDLCTAPHCRTPSAALSGPSWCRTYYSRRLLLPSTLQLTASILVRIRICLRCSAPIGQFSGLQAPWDATEAQRCLSAVLFRGFGVRLPGYRGLLLAPAPLLDAMKEHYWRTLTATLTPGKLRPLSSASTCAYEYGLPLAELCCAQIRLGLPVAKNPIQRGI